MSEIYGNQSPDNIPSYNLSEAAKYLRMAPATLRSWTIGRPYPKLSGEGYFRPLIGLPKGSGTRLSFANLIEAHVLWALRTEHGVPIKAVRTALDYSQRTLKIDRLLLSPQLRTNTGDIFLEKYGQLINLSKSGQLAIKKVLEGYLKRVEWKNDVPTKLYPFLSHTTSDDQRVISINPLVSFGKPVIEKKGISTSIIVNRIDAGESVDDLAADYNLTKSDIELAAVYERAA